VGYRKEVARNLGVSIPTLLPLVACIRTLLAGRFFSASLNWSHLIEIKEQLVDISLPKIRRLRATPVNVPLAGPHPTGQRGDQLCAARPHGFRNGPGADGPRLRVLLTPIALTPIAELIEALQPLVQGDAVVEASRTFPIAWAARVHRDSHGGYRHGGLGRFGEDGRLSLTRLLGGEENPVPAYHSLDMAGPDGAAQEAAESMKMGFRCVKFKVGYPHVEQDRAVIRAARGAGRQ
jgi:mandelate racemase